MVTKLKKVPTKVWIGLLITLTLTPTIGVLGLTSDSSINNTLGLVGITIGGYSLLLWLDNIISIVRSK